MISLKQLRYFNAVVRTGHFGKAAEQCAVTQPALSMQIQELEKDLGAPLLERGRKLESHAIVVNDVGLEMDARRGRGDRSAR